MPDDLLLPTILAALLLIAGGAAALASARRSRSATPSFRMRQDPRRAARDAAIVAAVRLAAELARCDGEVHATEMDAIHDFLTRNVKRRDVPWAARIMRAGLHDARNPEGLEAAFAALRGMDTERLDLVLRLLVAVARADGRIHDEERAFLARVADSAGVDPARLEVLLDTPDERLPEEGP